MDFAASSTDYVVGKATPIYYNNNLLFSNDYDDCIRSTWYRGALEEDGILEIPDMNKNNTGTMEFEFALKQNYPNPFNPETKINYSVAKDGNVSLIIYDIMGREVLTLVNEQKTMGNYTVSFNASTLTSGIYFYRIQTGNFVETKKMVFLK
ncbi:MAG: T9SS type A sorting domain-containing protein [Syntrophothermus sp.]